MSSSIPAENPMFSRNLGFYSNNEQARFQDSTVAIIGAGGDGGALAEGLVRLGVGRLILADPEPFDIENLNRQAFSNHETVGQNKAIAVAEALKKINPLAEIVTITEGVNEDNVQSIVQDSDLVADESEFTMHELGVLVARTARKEKVPVLMALNVGFGGYVTSYHPSGKTFESCMGLDENASLKEIAAAKVPLSRWLPRVPSYADLDTFLTVSKGEKSAPSVGSGVNIAAGMAIVESSKHLSDAKNRGEPVYAPKWLYMDACDRKSGIINHPLATHYASLARMIIRSKLGINPPASY